MTLSREDILNAQDLITDYIEIPAWGGRVKVQAAPVGDVEFVRFVNRPERVQSDKRRPPDLVPPSTAERESRRIVGGAIMGAIDEDGKRLFDWKDADDLRKKYWWAVCDVAAKAFELAGREADTVGDIEEGKDFSEPAPTSDSSID